MQQIVQEPPVNCNALPIKQTISHRVIQKRLQILLSYKGIWRNKDSKLELNNIHANTVWVNCTSHIAHRTPHICKQQLKTHNMQCIVQCILILVKWTDGKSSKRISMGSNTLCIIVRRCCYMPSNAYLLLQYHYLHPLHSYRNCDETARSATLTASNNNNKRYNNDHFRIKYSNHNGKVTSVGDWMK